MQYSLADIILNQRAKMDSRGLFHLREKVIFTCISPDFGAKIGSQSFSRKDVHFFHVFCTIWDAK